MPAKKATKKATKKKRPGYRVVAANSALGEPGDWVPSDEVPNGHALVRAGTLTPEEK